MKKLIAMLLALVMVLSLAACGASAPATEAPKAEEPKVEENLTETQKIIKQAETMTLEELAKKAIEEALEDAKRKFVGPNPKILALPLAFKTGAVHLCMKDDDLSNV